MYPKKLICTKTLSTASITLLFSHSKVSMLRALFPYYSSLLSSEFPSQDVYKMWRILLKGHDSPQDCGNINYQHL